MEGATGMQQMKEKVPQEVQIVAMLYDGAIEFIGKAREKMETGDSAGRSHFLKKASAIVKELLASLNMDGGSISLNLKNLYEFVLECIMKADGTNDIDALHNAEKVLEIIRGAWHEMQEADSV